MARGAETAVDFRFVRYGIAAPSALGQRFVSDDTTRVRSLPAEVMIIDVRARVAENNFIGGVK